MRTLRGLYLTVMYIFALPLFVVGMILMGLLNIKHPIDGIKAWMWGLQLGHKSNMAWVKTGQRI